MHSFDLYILHIVHGQQLAERFNSAMPWIIERLDRKVADVISSNIVEKCDVTLSRAIQPLTSDVLRVLFFLAYFTLSVFDYAYWPCFEVKDEEDLLLEKTVRGYKTGRGKNQSK